MKRLLTACLSLLVASVCVEAQINTPAASPTAEYKITVGLTDITLNYSRPGVKDRTIFAADGLVPYGEIWRTGANAATTIEFSEDIVFGGQDVEAGKYALYTIPNESSWEIMLYSDVTLGGNTPAYDAEKEVARVSAEVFTMPFSVETFVIDILNIRDNSCELGLIWDNVYVGVPVKLHTDKQVMEQIEEFTANPMAQVANNYLNSGWYLHNSGTDSEKAAKYMKKGIEHAESPFVFFWMGRTAEVMAANGDYAGAIKMAKKAHEAGSTTDNDNARNFYESSVKAQLDENIKMWSEKS